MNDDQRKKDLKLAWKAEERRTLASSIPVPHKDLRDLFDHLDRSSGGKCDYTLGATIAFLECRHLDPMPVVEWLRKNGGYCDCEVISNVENVFGEFVGR